MAETTTSHWNNKNISRGMDLEEFFNRNGRVNICGKEVEEWLTYCFLSPDTMTNGTSNSAR